MRAPDSSEIDQAPGAVKQRSAGGSVASECAERTRYPKAKSPRLDLRRAVLSRNAKTRELVQADGEGRTDNGEGRRSEGTFVSAEDPDLSAQTSAND